MYDTVCVASFFVCVCVCMCVCVCLCRALWGSPEKVVCSFKFVVHRVYMCPLPFMEVCSFKFALRSYTVD